MEKESEATSDFPYISDPETRMRSVVALTPCHEKSSTWPPGGFAVPVGAAHKNVQSPPGDESEIVFTPEGRYDIRKMQ